MSMKVRHTFAEIEAMSPEELEETNQKMAKKLVRNVISGVASTVVVHFASSALIGYLESKQSKNPEDHEVPTTE